jgi:hypothetical protein
LVDKIKKTNPYGSKEENNDNFVSASDPDAIKSLLTDVSGGRLVKV